MINFDDVTASEFDLHEEPTDAVPILTPKSPAGFVVNLDFFDEVTEILPEGHCEWQSLTRAQAQALGLPRKGRG